MREQGPGSTRGNFDLDDASRVAALAANLDRVRERLVRACASAGRSPDEVTLVAVTKTYPAEDVVRLARLGITHVGENRDQEAAEKAIRTAAGGACVTWHFVGRLQRNKCRSVVGYADVVHSVDSVRLAAALARAAADRRETPVDVLVQVSLDGDAARGGAVRDDREPDLALERVLAAVADAERLRLRGVMAVAPLGWSAERAFAQLADVAQAVVARYPHASWISAGMSGDLETAVAYGSTHVRVGSALLGKRAPLR